MIRRVVQVQEEEDNRGVILAKKLAATKKAEAFPPRLCLLR